MTIKLRATGRDVLPPKRNEDQRYPLPHVQAAADREAIAERRFAKLNEADERSHDEAVKAFDFRYKDICADPMLLREAAVRRQVVADEAVKNRTVVDWSIELPKIGDEVRRLAGLPYGEERERKETLNELRKSRGLPLDRE